MEVLGNSAIWEPQKVIFGWSGCRLTLDSGSPAPTSDITAATSVRLMPYTDNQISLYDGASWGLYTVASGFGSISYSLSGLTADTNYDVWCYLNSGTPALDITAWSSATTRATAITRVNDVSVYVKNGDATRRYMGTIRTTGTTGQSEDSFAKRYCWNYSNQIQRDLYNSDSNAHLYASATVQEWGTAGTPFGRCQFVLGVGQIVNAGLSVVATNQALARVGFDTTTSGENPVWYASGIAAGTRYTQLVQPKALAEGFHYATVNESCSGGTSSNFANAYLRVHIFG